MCNVKSLEIYFQLRNGCRSHSAPRRMSESSGSSSRAESTNSPFFLHPPSSKSNGHVNGHMKNGSLASSTSSSMASSHVKSDTVVSRSGPINGHHRSASQESKSFYLHDPTTPSNDPVRQIFPTRENSISFRSSSLASSSGRLNGLLNGIQDEPSLGNGHSTNGSLDHLGMNDNESMVSKTKDTSHANSILGNVFNYNLIFNISLCGHC